MESVASTNRDRECRAVAEAVRALGNLDIVLANAGIGGLTPVGETELATFEKIIRINLTVVFFTAQFVAPHVNEKASIILNDDSVIGNDRATRNFTGHLFGHEGDGQFGAARTDSLGRHCRLSEELRQRPGSTARPDRGRVFRQGAAVLPARANTSSKIKIYR
jgi:hypothetical protein